MLLSLLRRGKRGPELSFLGWAFKGGVYFGQESGSTLGSIGMAMIGAGAIPLFRGMQEGSSDTAGLFFFFFLVVGCICLAAGYGQYISGWLAVHDLQEKALHSAAAKAYEQGKKVSGDAGEIAKLLGTDTATSGSIAGTPILTSGKVAGRRVETLDGAIRIYEDCSLDSSTIGSPPSGTVLRRLCPHRQWTRMDRGDHPRRRSRLRSWS